MNRTQECARSGRLVGLVVACTAFAACADGPDDWPDGEAMFERASAELEGIEGHSWAGLYRGAGPFGDEWAVAPETGVVQHDNSWCGFEWTGYWGPIDNATEVCITLDFDGVERDEEKFRLPDPRLHLVRWQDLQFLIPPEGIEAFCAAYSEGFRFPSAPFRYLGADDDFDHEDPERPPGRPEVPSAYRELPFDVPITCTMVEQLEHVQSDSEVNEGWVDIDAVYRVDAGAEQGLKEGMRLGFPAPSGYWVEWGRVSDVGVDTAQSSFGVHCELGEAPATFVGTSVSTSAPDLDDGRD